MRVLVVEEEAETVQALAELLRQSGHAVRVAYDGRSALKIAAEFKPEAALLDLVMPNTDGYEIARRLRELPGLERILLVAVTGLGAPVDHGRSHAEGFAAHFVKPVDVEALRGLLKGSST
jgi:two-component system CheB/CheR fusion protein